MNRVKKMSEEQRIELAEEYKEMLNGFGLENYRKVNYITLRLGISARKWRMIVENVMHLYMYRLMDKLIVGTNKGYIYTNDMELIEKFILAKEHQFKSLAYNCYNLRKALQYNDNMTMDEYLKSIK